MITPQAMNGQFLALLREAFESSTHHWSYFVSEGPDGGVFGTLDKLSAEQAFHIPAPGVSSIASQVAHLIFAMHASYDWLIGKGGPRNWNESWNVRGTDEAEWTRLQSDLRQAYEQFAGVLDGRELNAPESFGGAMGTIAHVAYHLGVIRRTAALIR